MSFLELWGIFNCHGAGWRRVGNKEDANCEIQLGDGPSLNPKHCPAQKHVLLFENNWTQNFKINPKK
jgi:hypothetical protein